MHTRLIPVSNPTDLAYPVHSDFTAPHAPTAPSLAVTFFIAPAVDPAVFGAAPDRRNTASFEWSSVIKRGRSEDVLSLWVADMDHVTAPAVISTLLQRTRHGIFGYSEPDEACRTTLTGWFSHRYDWQVGAEWNTVAPGVVPALALAARVPTAPSEMVLVEELVYHPFHDIVEVNEHTVAAIPLMRGVDGIYRRDSATLEETIEMTGIRLLLLCNPYNPVGQVWNRKGFATLEEATARHGVAVMADEIHADLVLSGLAATLFTPSSETVAAHTITYTSPSKLLNLTGLQVTNILISDAHLRRAFHHELATTGYSQPNTLGLTVCRAVYESRDAWPDALHEHIVATRAHVEARLGRIEGIEATPCEDTHPLWPDYSGFLKAAGLEPEQLDEAMLNEAGLWLDDGRVLGAGGEGFTRINIARPHITPDAALDRLKTAVAAVTTHAAERAGQGPAALSA